jgi:hypothetical protein
MRVQLTFNSESTHAQLTQKSRLTPARLPPDS